MQDICIYGQGFLVVVMWCKSLRHPQARILNYASNAVLSSWLIRGSRTDVLVDSPTSYSRTRARQLNGGSPIVNQQRQIYWLVIALIFELGLQTEFRLWTSSPDTSTAAVIPPSYANFARACLFRLRTPSPHTSDFPDDSANPEQATFALRNILPAWFGYVFMSGEIWRTVYVRQICHHSHGRTLMIRGRHPGRNRPMHHSLTDGNSWLENPTTL